MKWTSALLVPIIWALLAALKAEMRRRDCWENILPEEWMNEWMNEIWAKGMWFASLRKEFETYGKGNIGNPLSSLLQWTIRDINQPTEWNFSTFFSFRCGSLRCGARLHASPEKLSSPSRTSRFSSQHSSSTWLSTYSHLVLTFDVQATLVVLNKGFSVFCLAYTEPGRSKFKLVPPPDKKPIIMREMNC